jgi:cytoskeleton protein RodZ
MQRPRTSPPTAQSNPPQQVRTEPTPQQQPPAPAPVQTAEAPATQPESTPTQPATQPATPPAAATETPAAASASTPATPGPVHVEIVAEEAVWVLARVDGKFAFSDTLSANTKKVLDGANDVFIRLGNAGGVSITHNGKSIGAAGPKGQVRSLQFTSGGFQIVSAKPAPAVPLDPLDR